MLKRFDQWYIDRLFSIACTTTMDGLSRQELPSSMFTFAFAYDAFLATFLLIAFMEIGDKTQIVVIALASKSKQTGMVALGSSLGISAVIILGVAVGTILDLLIPVEIINVGGAIIFIVLGLVILAKSKKHNDESDQPNNRRSRLGVGRRSMLVASAISVGLMEFGDKTQVATITLAATYDSPLSVALGAIVAETTLMILAAFIGAKLLGRIRRDLVDYLSATLFILAGILMLTLR
ncbi:MAG: TMEM165/GDT1 family protein [Candidatus Atabeyarchaeum deiterrae]